MSSGTRLLVVFTFAVALVVGGVVALVLGSWWILLVALGAHAVATAAVLAVIGNRLAEEDKPDPLTEARIADPDTPDEEDERRVAV